MAGDSSPNFLDDPVFSEFQRVSSAVRIHPCEAVDASIRPPGSKSITNRAVVCAALARGTSRLTGVLDSEDTSVMISAWRQLGLDLVHDVSRSELTVVGCEGKPPVDRARAIYRQQRNDDSVLDRRPGSLRWQL